VTHSNNGQTPSDLLQTADLLRRERPEASAVRLDEIKRDVITRSTSSRQPRIVTAMRRKLMALTLFVLLFSLSTSSAAASLLSWVSGGSFGSNTLGYGSQSGGTQFFFGSFGWGGDSSDDAGKETYCPDDKGSDDGDGSSDDDSDGDKSGTYSTYSGGGDDGSDDGDRSSGDQSDESEGECESDEAEESSDDGDRSSGDHSDEKSDDGDQSSDDNSDGDSKSDDGDRSSGDHSDEKSDDGDGSSDDQSDGDEKSDDGDRSSDDQSDEKSDDGDYSSDDGSD
jgi:hypothetical protein